jgi:hypothetical protein
MVALTGRADQLQGPPYRAGIQGASISACMHPPPFRFCPFSSTSSRISSSTLCFRFFPLSNRRRRAAHVTLTELQQQYSAGNEAAVEVEARAEADKLVTQGCDIRSYV